MMTKYLGIKPVGQLNDFSCWAACLSWWLQAVNHSNRINTKRFTGNIC